MIERGRSVVGFLSDGKTALFSHDWGTLDFPVFHEPFPSLTARPRQNVTKLTHKTRKYINKKIQRAESALLRHLRTQYYPATAWADLRIAALRNEDIVLNAFILLMVIGFATTVTVFDFALLFLNTAYDISALTGIDMRILILVVGGVLVSLGGWVSAFLMNMMSIAILDGAHRKLKSTVRTTFRTALSMASAVTTAWFMLAVRSVLPALSAVIIGTLYLKFFYDTFTLPLLVWAVAAATMMTWSLVNFLRFSLAPYIVLFERAPIPQAFKRSNTLLKYRGKVFLLSVYISLVALLAAMYGAAYLIESIVAYDKYPVFAVMGVFGLSATNGMLVMLYRKRKLSRKH
jgi:hypothetical protein